MRSFRIDQARVAVCDSPDEAGHLAAVEAFEAVQAALADHREARVIFATGNSQMAMLGALREFDGIDWARVVAFHMDEYVGLSDRHPASFRRWIRERVAETMRPKFVHYLRGDARDPAAECLRYAELLTEHPIDVCLLGIGENGHIAFNDPHVAQFDDPETVKLVDLDEKCRLQQVGEGHFHALDEVPKEALTVTCPGLLRAKRMICTVPDRRKAEAVRDALTGPVAESCPGSVLRTHAGASLYLDAGSACLLPTSWRRADG